MMRSAELCRLVFGLALAAAIPTAGHAAAPDGGLPATFWDIALGSHAAELSLSDFGDFACGTNGGPPATPLPGWTAFGTCAAEPGSGLREVYFRYDDEAEYWALARNMPMQAAASRGTTLYAQPVILSALFDEDGFVLALRAVSDPRVPVTQREMGAALRNFLVSRFGLDDWACSDLPREEGETDFGGSFLKEQCRKEVETADLGIEARYLRKPGQFGIDPHSGERVQGLFVSETRFEMRLRGAVPDREARLAAVAAGETAAVAGDRERAMNCPGCDLRGVNLKRQDLRGANLAGADLSGAILHAANLAGADLTGATLTGANLNRADLRRARLAGAKLVEALLYDTRLEAADLSQGDLSRARMAEASLVRANLSGARLVAVDLSNGRLSDANLEGADIGGTWLPNAELSRANLRAASILEADLSRAKLVGANLAGADMRGTDLYGADLRRADLTGANFSSTRLTTALLTEAQTEGTIFEDVTR